MSYSWYEVVWPWIGLGSSKLFIFGIIGAPVLVILQILNGPICFALAWLMSRVKGGSWVQIREN